jgi:hypothetical protein
MADNDNRTDDERRREAAEAEAKRIAQAEEDRKAREQAEADRRKAAREAPLVPNAEGNVMIEAIMGPYRGQRLTVKEAEGTAAINDHWARNPNEVEYQHDELSEEDRKAAWDASHKWAKETWEAAGQPPDEAPEVRQAREEQERQRQQQRDMQPEQAPGYKTRQAPAPAPKR